MIELEPIGTIHTPLTSTEEAPSQGVKDTIPGRLDIDPAYESGLQGIEVGDDLDIIWYADEADRTLLELDKVLGRGVFNSRSPARPNPIVVTTCTVTAIDGTEIEIEGVDMLDGSPVLDLKAPLGRDIENPPSRASADDDE